MIDNIYTRDVLDKIGNTLVYLADNVSAPTKTKLLKLIYILEEASIKKYGTPFFNIPYHLWKFGPVAQEVFIDLSTKPTIFKNYIKRETTKENHVHIKSKKKFVDDEFSDNDIELLENITKAFKNKTAKQLVNITHHEKSPWYITAKKHNVLDELINEKRHSTKYIVDLSVLVEHDEFKKRLFEMTYDFKEEIEKT